MTVINRLLTNLIEKFFPNYIKLGDTELNRKNFRKSIEYYTKASDKQTKNPYLHYNWAAALFAEDRFDEAIHHLEMAIHLKKDYFEAYSHLGLILLNQNKPDQALKNFVKALEINPDDPKSFLNMGFTLDKLGKPHDAVKMYAKAIESIPKHEEYRDNLEDKTFIRAMNQIALYELSQRNYEKAIEYYTKILNIDNDFVPGYYNLSIAYAEADKQEKCLSSLKLAIGKDRKNRERAQKEPVFEKYKNTEAFRTIFSSNNPSLN